MNTHTKIQIIEHNGEPAFAIIPYKEYLKLIPKDKDEYIPNEVVGLMVKKRYNSIKAWRIYLGLTQKEIAQRAGITQAALSQMEKSDNELKTATLEKLAKAMGLSIEQIQD